MTTESLPQGLEKTKWNDLEVGDYVVVSHPEISGLPMQIVKIVRISATRQFALEGGLRFTANGREIGGDAYHFKTMYPAGYRRTWSDAKGEKPTYYQLALRSIAQHADLVRRRKLLLRIYDLAGERFDKLSADQLERILAICKEGKQDGNQK